MSRGDSPIDQRLVKALAHPLRVRLLAILNERVASPNELAQEVGADLGVVSYHVRTLNKLKAVELVRTEPRRGAVEHYYRATRRPFFAGRDWTDLPESVRRSISAETLGLMWDDVEKSTSNGAFDSREDRHLSRTPLVLDDQGWDELGQLLADLLHRALDIQAESASRLAEVGAEGLATKLEMMHFPAVEAPARAGQERPAGARKRGGAKSKS
ncbi:MAG: ArsR/SmtB family transcription factor [Thermoleophilaceae bacterium]